MQLSSNLAEPLIILSIDYKTKDVSERLQLHIKNLRRVILHPLVVRNKVMIVSISGAMRTGKSFLMNLFIKYLNLKTKEFVAFKETSTDGFNWGPLEANETQGIWIWSEPFIIETPNKEEVAVLLVDCQGEFGRKLSIKETTKIYAFCQLISSLHLFNVDSQMNENNFSWLTLFTNYATIASQKCTKNYKLYQSICFIIRDWPYPYKYNYGLEGGQQYIQKFLGTEEGKIDADVKRIRIYFKSQYQDIKCFLLPFIGDVGATSGTFNGKLDLLTEEFQSSIWNLIEAIFSPHLLIIKEILGENVTGRDMVVYIENCFNAVTSIENPTPLNILDACLETNYNKTFTDCCKYYSDLMNKRNFHGESYEEKKIFHEQCKMSTLQRYDDAPKFENSKIDNKFRIDLEIRMDDDFDRFYSTILISQSFMPGNMLVKVVICIIVTLVIGILSKVFRILQMQIIGDVLETVILLSIITIISYCLYKLKSMYNNFNI